MEHNDRVLCCIVALLVSLPGASVVDLLVSFAMLVACRIVVVAQTSLLLLNYYPAIVENAPIGHPAAFTATAIPTATTTSCEYHHPLVLRPLILLPIPASLLRLSRA